MLRHIEGFDQYQGQVGQTLLGSLTSAGFNVSSGLAITDGRKPDSFALELQVAAGTAGDSWSSRSNNIRQDLRAIAAHNGGRMVAVGNNGAGVGSDDGITFLPVILGVSANMRDIEVAANTWIAVGTGSTIMRSTNGKDFSARPAPLPNVQLNSVATNGAGVWVAVGANGAAGAIFVSVDDGVNWGVGIGMGAKANNSIDYGDNTWVVVGVGGQVLTSSDGVNFMARASGVTVNLGAVAYSTPAIGHWLMAADKDIRRSVDNGVTWQLVTAAIMPQPINSIDFSDGRWMVVGNNGNIRMTDDEDTWQTPSFTGVGTTPLYCVYALHGTRSGWAVVGALNVTQTPITARTAVIYVSLAPPTRVKRFYAPQGKFTIGFAHYATARGRILSITDVLDMDWPAQIEINDTAGLAIPARNVWYYYELTIDRVALTATLHINNVLDLSVPLDPAVADMEVFEVTWIAENGAVARIDDIYMVDAATPAGETLVDRLSPIFIPLRLPDNDATPNEWIPASGTQHWPMVGLLPPAPESYIRSGISGKMDLFTSGTPLPPEAGTVDAPILAVGIIALAKKGDIDNRQLGLVLGPVGPTQKVVTDTVLSVVPEYSQAIFEKAPGDVAWDATNTAAVPFGVVVKP